MRNVLLIMAIVVFAAIGGLVLNVQLRPPAKPKITVTFLGYTNTPTGALAGRFVVSNGAPWAVQMWAPWIAIQSPTNSWGEPVRGVGAPVLTGHATKAFFVTPPTNRLPWRLEIRLSSDVGVNRMVKDFIMYRLYSLRLRPKYYNMPQDVYGEWIKE
jgi:hypothetical protein